MGKRVRQILVASVFFFVRWTFIGFDFLLGTATRMFKRTASRPRPTLLALESGRRGWDLIEYKELYQSAVEYLGDAHVIRVSVEDPRRFFKQVRKQLSPHAVTHYFYDPRTGPQTLSRSIIEVIKLSLWLTYRGITPIARLTDVPHRHWRALSVLVTARRGICLTLMCPQMISGLFPRQHGRVYGPFPMPFSAHTYHTISDRELFPADRVSTEVGFCGSLYEPRTSFLQNLSNALSEDGIQLKVRGRKLGETRMSDQDYWDSLSSFPITITTADQVTGHGMDTIRQPHLIYRYTEALACGSALVASFAPGCWKYFRPGLDFFPYTGAVEAREAIIKLAHDSARRDSIARSGQHRVELLAETSTFWRSIDLILGARGFLKQDDLG